VAKDEGRARKGSLGPPVLGDRYREGEGKRSSGERLESEIRFRD